MFRFAGSRVFALLLAFQFLTVPVTDATSNPRVVAAIGLGNSPFGVAVDPVTNTLYVANTISNTVSVIDGATNSTLKWIKVLGPTAVAVNPTTDTVYVAMQNGGNLTVINGATNTTSAV